MVTIFESLLELNPYLRPTAQECLKNKVFDPYRDLMKERVLNHMQRKRQHNVTFSQHNTSNIGDISKF